MILESSAFRHDSPIPVRHTGEGLDLSPPLSWYSAPQGCKSFAVVCQDLDAKIPPHWESTFVHWLIYNIPEKVQELSDGVPRVDTLLQPVRATQGTNHFGKIGYCGPLPPFDDEDHHYRYTVYALDADLHLPAGIMYKELMDLIEGHVLTSASIEGVYHREETPTSYQSISRDAPSPELGQ